MQGVYIEWEDHCQILPEGGGAWLEMDTITNRPSVITTIGFAVKEDEKYLTIASCHDEEGAAFKGVSTIIKSCIVSRKELPL